MKMFLVKYYGGNYDDWYDRCIFVTSNEETAQQYVRKFNKILYKWKEYYKRYESDDCGFRWISDEFIETHYDRWNCLRNITKCYYNEIDAR